METIIIIIVVIVIIIIISKGSATDKEKDVVIEKPLKIEKNIDNEDIVREILHKNPKLNEAAKTGDFNEVNKALGDDLNLVSSIFTDYVYGSQPAEKYRQKALSAMMYPIANYNKAIELLNKGLEHNDPEIEPLLYQTRADCFYTLEIYEKALNDINKALELFNIDSEKNREDIICCLYERADIRKSIGEIEGATKDRELAKKMSDK